VSVVTRTRGLSDAAIAVEVAIRVDDHDSGLSDNPTTPRTP
jgi:hypothetical protein